VTTKVWKILKKVNLNKNWYHEMCNHYKYNQNKW